MLLFLFQKFKYSGYLSFSDAAKFADVARNLVSGNGFISNFSFFNTKALNLENSVSVARWISPAMPLIISSSFKIFGISDFSVILVSIVFFVSLVVTTYLLGNKLFGKLVGALSSIAIAFNINFLDYATSGASETLFAFEIVFATYLLIFRKKTTNTIAIIVMILMYLTRPQAIIYIFALVFLYFLFNFPIKKALIFTLGIFAAGSILFITRSIQGVQGLFAVTQSLPGESSSDALRGAVQEVSLVMIIKKVFYNLYNFYKALPEIANPYLWALFIIGLFQSNKNRLISSSKLMVLFMVAIVFVVSALTIPFYRYLHPIVPFVYIFAIATLVWIVEKIIDSKVSIFSYLKKSYSGIKKEHLITGISTFLIFFFVVGQTLGVIFLDSRFTAKRLNKEKPPVYVQLSWKLKEITNPENIIITNLDTWGSWYGERKTVWFPLEPNQLIPLEGQENPFDAIYLTSYLMDDENYYMGDEWRQIFYNPENPENEYIRNNYTLKGIYEIPAEETYEKQAARAVLLTRKIINGL